MIEKIEGFVSKERVAKEIQEVSLPDIHTFSVLAQGGPETSKEAFATLEAHLFAAQGNKNLKGRKFYGVLQPDGRYRACLALMPGDDIDKLGCEPYTIPTGRYAKTKIENWPENTAKIGPTFDNLSSKYVADNARPAVEFYRSHTELIIYLPIK